MVERALVLAVAAVALAATVILARWWLGRGVAGLRTSPAEGLWTALGTAPDGRPSLVVLVLTAPSTALLAGDGRVRSFNHGFAAADQLSAQLIALGASPASPR